MGFQKIIALDLGNLKTVACVMDTALMQNGKVLVENWHSFTPASPHAEGGKTNRVVNKEVETADAFARRVLGDLYDRVPIMVLNDEAHHCYCPAPLSAETKKRLSAEELKDAQAENEEATVWIEGLDKLNNVNGGVPAGQKTPGITLCGPVGDAVLHRRQRAR
ncbi:MAG TPA: hypothetical protein VGN72_00035 [Tepidisphaeraceae bacterium]|jgi:type III restriction enzyme|nr:hypothetical protein [Tepidisphaeraceae bacterium]